ncbi:MAG: AraC family transcriptional regulator [Caldilineaceae bacterium]|nr:AraC family transcriptional regulator [Caldilineaceae bacterium]
MQPQIITKPAFTVVGLLVHTIPKSPEIPQLWEEFVPRMDEIAQGAEPDVSYGVMAHNEAMNKLDYMAGMAVAQVDELPPGMNRWDLPANTYAVFATTLAMVGETFGYIFNQWLPTADYQAVDAPYFEYYGEDFSPAHPALSIYIPVQKKG